MEDTTEEFKLAEICLNCLHWKGDHKGDNVCFYKHQKGYKGHRYRTYCPCNRFKGIAPPTKYVKLKRLIRRLVKLDILQEK